MSVSCSKTLIFAPECWKCILRGTDFINFPGGGGGVCPWTTLETGVSFFRLCLLQSFCHLLKTLLKLLEPLTTFTANKSKIKQKGHLNCSITQPAKTDLSPCSLPLGDVSRGGTSATQWQKLHADDVKSVQNLVITTDWTMEYSHSFRKD